mgnify:CR=1 FL=1
MANACRASQKASATNCGASRPPMSCGSKSSMAMRPVFPALPARLRMSSIPAPEHPASSAGPPGFARTILRHSFMAARYPSSAAAAHWITPCRFRTTTIASVPMGPWRSPIAKVFRSSSSTASFRASSTTRACRPLSPTISAGMSSVTSISATAKTSTSAANPKPPRGRRARCGFAMSGWTRTAPNTNWAVISSFPWDRAGSS